MRAKKSKPIFRMTPEERESCFDEIGRAGDEGMLQDAREGKGQDFIIAVAILILPSGSERNVYWDDEYGDYEAIHQVDEAIAGMLRMGLLKPGESLRRDVVKVTAFHSIQTVKQ